MNFREIKFIVQYLQKRIVCPECRHKYRENNIAVVGTNKNEIVLLMECEKCFYAIFVSAILNKQGQFPEEITIRNPQQYISENDILDMHNFLKNLQGDITSYLT